MSWSLRVTPQPSGAPLTPEQLTAGRAQPVVPGADPRPWLAARVAACRACEHVARGGATCAACDIRCAHTAAAERPPLLAEPESVCPANLWPFAS